MDIVRACERGNSMKSTRWIGLAIAERTRVRKRRVDVRKRRGRSVEDAGECRRQTLLWHRWGRVEPGDRRATAQRQHRVYPCSARRIWSLRRGGGCLPER